LAEATSSRKRAKNSTCLASSRRKVVRYISSSSLPSWATTRTRGRRSRVTASSPPRKRLVSLRRRSWARGSRAAKVARSWVRSKAAGSQKRRLALW